MRSRYEEIGGLFRKIREENGLKQSQMAEIADCSLRNYQNIELGITQPGYNTAQYRSQFAIGSKRIVCNCS